MSQMSAKDPPSVDAQGLAGDEAGVLGGEEGDGRGDVLRAAPALDASTSRRTRPPSPRPPRSKFLPGGERAETGVPEQWSVPAWEFEAQVRGTDKAAVEAAFAEACAQAVDRAQHPWKYGDTKDCGAPAR